MDAFLFHAFSISGVLGDLVTKEACPWSNDAALRAQANDLAQHLRAALEQSRGIAVFLLDVVSPSGRVYPGRRPGAEGKGCGAEGHGATHRHQHGGREVFPGHARRIRGVRDQLAARAPV
jgi:hypothetical protein